jgi:phosphoribosylanthranilate isomerase
MGFIFWPKSSRYVSERPDYLPERCKRVGVFVDEAPEQIKRIAGNYALDYIQLHGHETPEQISHLLPLASHLSLVKAFNIATADDFAITEAYEGVVDCFLFDTKGKCVGGNGEKFDWRVLDDYAGKTPFLLSGGIGPDDARRVNNFHHPQCIGIDLNSRFESAPALKDVQEISRFLKEMKY